MPATQAKKTERLETRVTPQQKQIIERAAILLGTSTTNFVLMAVQQAASETIRNSETLALRGEASKVFVDALLNPPAPNAALHAAAKRHLSARS
jgi:uncharacterized protein (DUF1778 family)